MSRSRRTRKLVRMYKKQLGLGKLFAIPENKVLRSDDVYYNFERKRLRMIERDINIMRVMLSMVAY